MCRPDSQFSGVPCIQIIRDSPTGCLEQILPMGWPVVPDTGGLIRAGVGKVPLPPRRGSCTTRAPESGSTRPPAPARVPAGFWLDAWFRGPSAPPPMPTRRLRQAGVVVPDDGPSLKTLDGGGVGVAHHQLCGRGRQAICCCPLRSANPGILHPCASSSPWLPVDNESLRSYVTAKPGLHQPQRGPSRLEPVLAFRPPRRDRPD